MTNTISELTDLCARADRHDRESWNQHTKGYRNADDSARAKSFFEQILVRREALVEPVLTAVRNQHDGHLLVVPEPDRGPLKRGRYRPHTWIDLHYSEDHDGVPIKFEKYGLPGVRPNTFRAWFTAAGVGLGIYPAPSNLAEYALRLSMFSAAVPGRFADREPSNSGWDRHRLGLAGTRSRKHIYLADWWNHFGNDDDFLMAVADCWSILGETLKANRL